jgi:phosphopantetheinyl transferase
MPLKRGEAPSSVYISIARTGSLLRAQSSHRVLTDKDWASFFALREPAARRSAIAARILLRLSLSRATGRKIAPSAWEFKRTPHGKPSVGNSLPDLSFSVSHVDEIAIVAVSSSLQVGIDVEAIDQDLNSDLIEHFCHFKEKPALSGLPTNQKTREFLRLWTQKEAYTKLVGLGHSMDFASIDHSSGQVETFGSLRVSPTHFEGFYIPLDQSLYYTSLAVQSSSASWTELQLFDVVGPEATIGPPLTPGAPLSAPAPQ